MRRPHRRATLAAIWIVVLGTAGCGGDDPPAGPTAEEQLVWQMTNRARADPAAEAARILGAGDPDVDAALDAFGVDRAQLTEDFAGYAARPPLAWHPQLAEAARRHALDLVSTRTQQHRGSDGSTPARRLVDAGVDARHVVENIMSAATSPFQAQAAFLVDWGGGPPTGVQGWPSPGHRMALLAPQSEGAAVTAMGAAWVAMPRSPSDPFGPFVLVQELADVDGTYVVGTVWRDTDGDGGYDAGEGVEGATVGIGSAGVQAETWSEGTYQLPVDGLAGTVTVRAVDADGAAAASEVELDGSNVLVDLALPVR